MSVPENALTNHEVTVCLSGGAVLGRRTKAVT